MEFLGHLKELLQIICWRIRRYFLILGQRLFVFLVPRRARFLFDDDDTEESYGAKFFSKLVSCLIILPIMYYFFSSYMPFGFWEFWHMPSSWAAVIQSYWPFIVWGIAIQSIVSFTGYNKPEDNHYAEGHLVAGFLRSGFAGITEEITFRWLFFLVAIPGLRVGNWFIFGFAGFGLKEWMYLHILGPIVNLVSLGLMHNLLFDPRGWFIGASLVATNAFFRDGHKYQGIIGFINSWFGGLVLFHAAFTYGLPCAILVHTTFNMVVNLVAYVDAIIEREFLGIRLQR